MNIKSALLGLLILTCISFSGLRIVRYYQANFPVASPGECLEIPLPSGEKLSAMVLVNDPKDKASLLIVKTPFGIIPDVETYASLRSLGARRVECEKVN